MVPFGTTARQAAAVGRWGLAALLLALMSWGWWPTLEGWGVLAAGLVAMWLIWLMVKILVGDSLVRHPPMALPLLAPAGILAIHLVRLNLHVQADNPLAVNGAMNASVIYQLALMVLGMLVADSFFGPKIFSPAIPAVVGGSLAAAAVVERAVAPLAHVDAAGAMLALAGAAAIASICWSPARRMIRFAAGVAAAIIVAAFAVLAPKVALLGIGASFLCPVLGGTRALRKPAGLVVVLLGLAAISVEVLLYGLPLIAMKGAAVTPFGIGESTFIFLTAADSGLAVMLGMIGWAGVAMAAAAFLAGAIWVNVRSVQSPWRAASWTAAAVLCGLAVLLPAGPFVPAVTLGTAVIWGLLPPAAGAALRSRQGYAMCGSLIGTLLLLGLVSQEGLSLWSAGALGRSDSFLHLAAGLLVTLVLAWLLGRRHIWQGLLAVAAGALLGGAGELAQKLLSSRDMEWSDCKWHAVGSAVACVLYLLPMLARGSEEARPSESRLARQ